MEIVEIKKNHYSPFSLSTNFHDKQIGVGLPLRLWWRPWGLLCSSPFCSTPQPNTPTHVCETKQKANIQKSCPHFINLCLWSRLVVLFIICREEWIFLHWIVFSPPGTYGSFGSALRADWKLEIAADTVLFLTWCRPNLSQAHLQLVKKNKSNSCMTENMFIKYNTTYISILWGSWELVYMYENSPSSTGPPSHR